MTQQAAARELECPGYCDLCRRFAWLHPTASDLWFCDGCDTHGETVGQKE
jgi:hypothetical protein